MLNEALTHTKGERKDLVTHESSRRRFDPGRAGSASASEVECRHQKPSVGIFPSPYTTFEVSYSPAKRGIEKMSITIVHLSDLHLRREWPEEQGFVLNEFLGDLRKQISSSPDVYVVFTGDIVQAGEDAEAYKYFSSFIGAQMSAVGIDRNNIMFVPGNHDIDRAYTKKNFSILKAIQERTVSESVFNNEIYGAQRSIFAEKFSTYLKWQKDVSSFAIGIDHFCGSGFDLTRDVGIYCLNTALFSFGGLEDENSRKIDDEGQLYVETRTLHKWVQSTTFRYRILAMHHPSNWLRSWAKSEIDSLAQKHFDLVLCGHTHETKSFHSNDGKNGVVYSVSPPLFTSKHNLLGYSLITVDKCGATSIRYRQWVGDCFVSGTTLSKTDDGMVRFGGASDSDGSANDGTPPIYAAIGQELKNAFDESLRCYSSLPAIWILPNVADQAERSTEGAPAVIQTADQICANLDDCVIKAPRQFGLTSLGRYIALRVWNSAHGRFTLFLEAKSMQNHEAAIAAKIKSSLLERGLTEDNLFAIVLDGVDEHSARLISNIKKLYPKTKLIILLTVDVADDLARPVNNIVPFKCATLYLWAFDRIQIRHLVQGFIAAGNQLDEDQAIDHLVNDLQNLNLHRSAVSCLTLLSIYEKQIDYSPNNRTEMLEKFLHLIFSGYKKQQNYSNLPDMKDSFYVLGKFSERLIRTAKSKFSRSEFLQFGAEYCKEMVIDVDCARLFDIMEAESVIVSHGNQSIFRYVSWVYFFAAHRMYHDVEFRTYILADSRYACFPEIIEYYSGIDRRRDELLLTLRADLERLNNSFEERTKIHRGFDPYALAKWDPSVEKIGEIKAAIQEEVNSTSLPPAVKDQFNDRSYDRSLPYIQEINDFIRDSSYGECSRVLKSAARALRNSDYVDPKIKEALLNEVIKAWSKAIQLIAVLSPLLARDRQAIYEGIHFSLSSGFDKHHGEELWYRIMATIPYNVVNFHEKDLSSARIAPLLSRFMENNESDIGRFIVASCLIRQRPKGWTETVRKYVSGLDKNAFFLARTLEEAKREYRYGFCSSKQKKDLEDLMGIIIAKHEIGVKRPSASLIKKVGEKVRGALT